MPDHYPTHFGNEASCRCRAEILPQPLARYRALYWPAGGANQVNDADTAGSKPAIDPRRPDGSVSVKLPRVPSQPKRMPACHGIEVQLDSTMQRIESRLTGLCSRLDQMEL